MLTITPQKQTATGKIFRIVENKTTDTNQHINYELQVYSRSWKKWFTMKTDVTLAPVLDAFQKQF